ncbi:HNH endonuclease [Lysobacter sp. yr284]|uniref:HNH endonuclease n=1 Tax=Lysobacter sp. yr284 TaxID=1761791 RepID=UPI000B8543D8|nr:HNH endonuclease [Lysobacter sp. yr284]
MFYAFDLKHFCGGYAYFSTFSHYIEHYERFEVRAPSTIVYKKFEESLAEMGRSCSLVVTDKAYERWLRLQGWAIVEQQLAQEKMPQWLRSQRCISSAYGSFVSVEIASPSAVKRSYRGRAKQRILSRDKNKCLLCGSAESLTLQHVVPYSAGGETSSGNLVTLCEACNQNLKNEVDIGLYQLAGLHHGYDPAILGEVKNSSVALKWARYLSSNLMHSRCELW